MQWQYTVERRRGVIIWRKGRGQVEGMLSLEELREHNYSACRGPDVEVVYARARDDLLGRGLINE
jgi:hypothetical protein